jgi:hypothetical protein
MLELVWKILRGKKLLSIGEPVLSGGQVFWPVLLGSSIIKYYTSFEKAEKFIEEEKKNGIE